VDPWDVELNFADDAVTTTEVGREYEQLQVEAFEKNHAVITREAVFISFYSAPFHKSFNLPYLEDLLTSPDPPFPTSDGKR